MKLAGEPTRVLLVEDNGADRRLIREYLTHASTGLFEVGEASNLAQARSLLETVGFDIILLDLGLPDSWGMETFHELRRLAPNVPLIIITGTDDESQALAAIQEGAKDYLVKGPLTQAAIVRTVRYTVERGRLEEALRANEEKFRTIADFTPGWEYWVGVDDRMIYVNPRCIELTGYAAEEFMADASLRERIIYSADLERFLRHQVTMENWLGHPRGELELRIVRRDGEVRWISHLCYAVIDARGKYQGRRVSNRDVTERYQNLRFVARARDLYLTLLEDLPYPIWRCGPDGRYNWFNRTWLTLTGRTLPQEVGVGATQRIHAADIELYLKALRESMAQRQPFHAEYRLRAADQSWRWMLDAGVPIRGIEGEFAGYLGACVDITERKAAEARIRTNDLRLMSLLEISHYAAMEPEELLPFALDQAVLLTDSAIGYLFLHDQESGECRLAFWSRGVKEGCPGAAAGARHSIRGAGLWGEVVRLGTPMVVNDYTADVPGKQGLPAGHPPLQRWLSVPVLHDGRIEAVVGVANKVEPYDDTDQMQMTLLMEGVWRVKVERQAVDAVQRLNAELERRVEERTRALEGAMRELESFSYSVSHDLRAPLRSLDGFSLALLEEYGDKLDAVGRDYLERVRAASRRMEMLIDDLLQLSRVSRHQMHHGPVNLSAIARDLLAELRTDEPGREVAVTVEPDVTVQGDPHLLRIALGNLLGNAWKFTSRTPAARVAFGTRAGAGGEREFLVSDNGAGFDPAHQEKLFVPFQRLHSVAEFPGTGIGLTIVRRIIQRHGGEIRAEGRPGAGATFTFTLSEAP